MNYNSRQIQGTSKTNCCGLELLERWYESLMHGFFNGSFTHFKLVSFCSVPQV